MTVREAYGLFAFHFCWGLVSQVTFVIGDRLGLPMWASILAAAMMGLFVIGGLNCLESPRSEK